MGDDQIDIHEFSGAVAMLRDADQLAPERWKAAVAINEMIHVGSVDSLERIEELYFQQANVASPSRVRTLASKRFTPRGLAQVAEVVTAAIHSGSTCKARGRGHAFSDAGDTDGYSIELGARHDAILTPDCLADPATANRLCRFEAGATIDDLNAYLTPIGRALRVQPGYGDLSYIGVMLAGGHGSGTRAGLGGLSSAVRSLELLVVTGANATVLLVRVEPTDGITSREQFSKVYPHACLIQDDELFQSCCVSMGTLGVVVAATVETRGRFNIEERRQLVDWSTALERLPQHLRGIEPLHSAELWVNPYEFPEGQRHCVESLRYETTDDPRNQRGIGIRVGSAVGYRVLARLLNSIPEVTPLMVSAGLSSTTTDEPVVMHSPLGLDFGAPNEAAVYAGGIAIPVDPTDIAMLKEVTTRIFAWVEARRSARRWVTSPIGLRFVPAASAPLSPAYGRMTCMLELCALEPTIGSRASIAEFVTEMLTTFASRGVRPHWGLINEMRAVQYQVAFPEAARTAFARALKVLDPLGCFENTLTERLDLRSPKVRSKRDLALRHPHANYGRCIEDPKAPRFCRAPTTIDEVRDALREAYATNMSLTLRAGGMSIHTQSLASKSSYLHMDRLAAIAIHPERQLAVVEPGATWGRIFDAARKHDLAPIICVTTREATAGGTLATNAISQASRLYGHEIDTVAWIRVLLPPNDATGEPRDQVLYADKPEDRELFCAIVGGFGLVGAVVEIAYRLQAVPPASRVVTTVRQLRRSELAAEIDTLRKRPDLVEDSEIRRAVSIFATSDDWKLFRFDMRTRQNADGDELVAYQGPTPKRMAAELAISNPLTVGGAHIIAASECARYAEEAYTFVNALDTYTFFMEANRRLKCHRSAYEPGAGAVPTVQQTYVLPNAGCTADFLEHVFTLLRRERSMPTEADIACAAREMHRRGAATPHSKPDWTRRVRKTKVRTRSTPESARDAILAARWLQEQGFMVGLIPAMFDIIWIPRDAALLSATHNYDGFAVTLAFQGLHLDPESRVSQGSPWARRLGVQTIELLRALSSEALRVGGSVHLTKSVYVDAPARFMEAMLGPRFHAFRQLRAAHDPRGVLTSMFGDTFFPR